MVREAGKKGLLFSGPATGERAKGRATKKIELFLKLKKNAKKM